MVVDPVLPDDVIKKLISTIMVVLRNNIIKGGAKLISILVCMICVHLQSMCVVCKALCQALPLLPSSFMPTMHCNFTHTHCMPLTTFLHPAVCAIGFLFTMALYRRSRLTARSQTWFSLTTLKNLTWFVNFDL